MKNNKIITFTELNYINPGSNYIKFGDHSGEEYFENFFKDELEDTIKNNGKIFLLGNKVIAIPDTYFRTIIELSCEVFTPFIVASYINVDYLNIGLHKLFYDIIDFYYNKPEGYKHPDNLKYAKRYN